MPDQRTFHVHDGLQFEREPSGDVMLCVYGMRVPVPAASWISAVAEMTADGAQVNHDLVKALHEGK